MKLNLKNTRLINCFFSFLAITLICLIYCLFELKYYSAQEMLTELDRHKAYSIADELRQSSDDLTTMARLYVTTSNKKYRNYYDQVLAIRNGIAPRPVKYDEPYWDLIIANKSPKDYQTPKSLTEMMLENHFTLKEFALLAKAENKSNALTQIEIKAMNAVDGKFQDSSGHYTIQGKPDPELAQKLLFNDEYMNTKTEVMQPIREFFEQVNSRVQRTILSIEAQVQHTISIALGLAFLSTIIMIFSIVQTLSSLSKANEENDLLLLNILPESIASRLKLGEQNIADEYPQASVMFADIINFSELTEQLGPKKTVTILNKLFAELDGITEKYHVEKVKTIGDNYMAVSGVPVQTTRHAINMANYSLAVLERMHAFNKSQQMNLQFRIGMTYGTVIAGVIGHKKFLYDVWGNVVNLASRLEKSALPNKIHISEKMAFMLEEEFIIEPYDTITVKGFGPIKTYFLLGKREEVLGEK
ncbi:MAG: adenylate/guanylate cyclase domain-containing protein [Legionella sp.]|uniref:adenylate/guanylate cyclase domain-containing protein n=1 Tax=Legionella sp. TaxID=459 RepID=UPI00284571CB|nr:adenylate/guanylate cyclase domain-containing protein [Legionella sp.]